MTRLHAHPPLLRLNYSGMALCPSDGVAARGFVNGRGPKPREALAHGRDRTEGPYRSEGHRTCRIVQSAPYPILSAMKNAPLFHSFFPEKD